MTMSIYDGLANYSSSKKIKDSDFQFEIESNGLYSRRNIEWYDKFERVPSLDPYNPVTVTREYVFYTKPELNIFNGTVLNPALANIPYFVDMYRRMPDVLRQWQKSASTVGKPASPFMNLLSNSGDSNLSLPSIDSNDIESSANIIGTKINYRLSSIVSDNDHVLSIQYKDTKYLEVYNLFKVYDEYERLKARGIVAPDRRFTINKVLHDQIAIYKFIVDADGETIIFYAKYTGCYPKNVPRDTFSDLPSSGGLSFSVDWKCNFVEDSDPMILAEFNHLVNNYTSGTRYSPLYNLSKNMVEREWVRVPYIESPDSSNRSINKVNQIARPKLKWRV